MASTNSPIPAPPTSMLAKPAVARKGSAFQPVLRRRVEPAIPLPYLQRRPKNPTASTQLPSPLRTNSEDAATSPAKEQPRAQPEQVNIDADDSKQTVDGLPAQTVEKNKTGVAKHEPVQHPQEPKPVSAGSATQGAVVSPPPAGEVTPPETAPSAQSSVSFPPPAMSPAPFNGVPPPFPPLETHPAQFRGPVPEPIRLPQLNLTHRAVHQHHPSNGSMVFGGFPGSNTPSPGPNSGGAFPPPMAREQMPMPGVDAFGRPMLPAAPNDGLVQVPMNHGPMTPHSFHESQSSRTADENGAIIPFMNGHNGMEFTRPRPPPGIARPPPPPNNQPHFNAEGLEIADAMMFTDRINDMFANPTFADCDICLVLPDRLTSVNSQNPGQLNAPLRLPAHKLILSMNPILANLMQKQAEQQQDALRRGLNEIRITSDDPYLRADSMWRAIKHVYGFRYVPMGKIAPDNSEVEKFHIVLGYAAAGALLEIPHISVNAMGEASKLLGWDTIEKGVEFALRESAIVLNRMDGPHGRLFPQFQYRHGVYVNELVEKIMMFIITHFPNNFTLDTTVDDPRYARLPPTLAAGETAGPQIANGIRGPPQVSSRKSMPRFGDLIPDENDSYGQAVSHQEPFEHTAALSRILLNLPFEMVKFLLESNGIGGVSGWQTAQDRRRALPHVVAARESRRLRFVSEFMAGRHEGPDPGVALRSQEPQLLEGVWNSVCWREQCVPNGDAPIIERVWEPFGDSR